MIGIMNIKLDKIRSENNKLSRKYKNVNEEKMMYQETSERLLIDLKKNEVEMSIMQSQITAAISKPSFNLEPFSNFLRQQGYPEEHSASQWLDWRSGEEDSRIQH